MGGLKRRAVRLKEPAYLYAALPTVGMPQCMPVRPIWAAEEARGAPFRRALVFRKPCCPWCACRSACRAPCMGRHEVARGAP